MFSIPSQINLSYTNVGLRPVAGSLAVGEAVKDLPEGSITPTKKENDRKIGEIQKKFEQDTKTYHEQMEVLTGEAVKAEAKIGPARLKKALVITLLAITVLAAVGLTAAAIATGGLGLFLLAAPFTAGIVTASYFTHVQRKEVSKLEEAINAPRNLKQPELRLPVYDIRKDYDLFQSRSDAQNAISQLTLEQLAQSGYAANDIVKYALLDRAAVVPVSDKPVFYSKCLQLIESHGTVVRQHQEYRRLIDNETYKLKSDLSRWSRDQEFHLDNQERVLKQRERELNLKVRRGEESVMSYDRLSLQLALSSHENQKIEHVSLRERRAHEIEHWKEQMASQNNSLFYQSANLIEQQFASLKTGTL